MFVSEAVKNHFETSATINVKSLVLAEWNMNMPDNIKTIGNYRYRSTETLSIYKDLPNTFDEYDFGDYYEGSLSSSNLIYNGLKNDNTPQQFISIDDKSKMLYSLEDCLKPFRPRSGINKASYFNNRYLANSDEDMYQRPRYYMPSRDDEFKYWTSYRKENGIERGVANIRQPSSSFYFIDDACPFVVYEDSVPANRIVVKMQTNVGDINLGPFVNNLGSIEDPLYKEANKTVPVNWKIQYLKGTNWVTAYSFKDGDVRSDGSPIIDKDGYVELEYGLIVPEKYKNSFLYVETLSSADILPNSGYFSDKASSVVGYAYLVKTEPNSVGRFYVWNGTGWDQFVPTYGWILGSESINNRTNFVKDLASPESFKDIHNNNTRYREFEYIDGIRIVVDTMNKFDCTFDLIEMSPRLVADISDMTTSFSITKVLSDLGASSIPVGQLLASTGKLDIFDPDQAFNDSNSLSIISKYLRKNVKFLFYEKILDVDGFDYYIPIKTLYSEGFPQADVTGAKLSIGLRDFYWFLESMPAPQLLMTEVSLSVAVCTILDYIGFTNYSFKRVDGEKDLIIPYFFVSPDQNVAEVLNLLAISSQSAMFFDEYNNFIIMSKGYMSPEDTERDVDFVLSGNNNQSKTGAYSNLSSGTLPNIIEIASQDKKVYNSGKINYTTRYIQRTYQAIEQADLSDKEKSWVYKPALLWEVSSTDKTKTVNEVVSQQSGFVLGAMPINSNLSNTPPFVSDGEIKNNILDLGENVYWLTRYNGYFYANGEIIKYDAAQFSITGTGNVWISSNEEYQRYFSRLPFNGKIYPTGLVRIYAEPYYEDITEFALSANTTTTRLKEGEVFQHGRGQFGTPIVEHYAGINEYWTSSNNVRGCNMQSQYLFSPTGLTVPSTTIGAAGVDNDTAKKSTRNSIIKNFMATNYFTETDLNRLKSTQTGTVQSSALVFNGPSFTAEQTPINFVTYVGKALDKAYKHFGTRMRIIGKIENNENRLQTPIGNISYYQVPGSSTEKNISIGGSSGGIAVLLNPETNNGYYFEIVALTENNIEGYLDEAEQQSGEVSINNLLFYKIKKDSATNQAIPIKLWGGLAGIIVDDGRLTGQYRSVTEENISVYDLAVEYVDVGSKRVFYLYINNKLVKIVEDTDPLPIYNNMALFTRGSARCMFENIYAIGGNYASDDSFIVGAPVSDIFGDSEIDVNESFKKYSMSGIIQATYLSNIGTQEPPNYNFYFDEFGTIMRECAYFNIKYDRAYPALYAQVSPTLNNLKGYNISGFRAGAYGAEFLIFNATDRVLVLDSDSGNYLRIQGITFTQDTTRELTVDDYFKKRGNLSDPEFSQGSLIYSPSIEKQKYNEIKISRMTYGKNEFSIDSPYIQSDDSAESLMSWIINKVMVPKKAIGVKMFPIPTLQLGDIVTIDYKNSDGLELVSDAEKRFIVYNIEYGRDAGGLDMTLYLSEV